MRSQQQTKLMTVGGHEELSPALSYVKMLPENCPVVTGGAPPNQFGGRHMAGPWRILIETPCFAGEGGGAGGRPEGANKIEVTTEPYANSVAMLASLSNQPS